MRRVFLKLDGIKGESQSARHAGAIEVSSFYWVAKQSPSSKGAGREHILINDLTIIKQPDKTSPFLHFASKIGQTFEGALTVEDTCTRKGAIRSRVYRLQAAVVDSVSAFKENEETVTLNCKRIKAVRF